MSRKRTVTIIALVLIAVLAVIGTLYMQKNPAVNDLNIGFPIPSGANQESQVSSTTNPYLNANIEIKTYQVAFGWGYDIFIDSKLIVHQTNIPALPGNSGFKTEADARKVAELAVVKIRKNIMPPSLSTEELKSVGITAEEQLNLNH
jgi:hypothetical protein